MFRTVYRLPFRLLGIPLQLDVTFLIILPVLAWMIGHDLPGYIGFFDLDIDPAPLQEGLMPYVLGSIAAVGLFMSIVIHELGHSVVGRSYGLEIKSITLWILGGMAQFERIPRRRGTEAIMAIAGPLTSYALGVICWLILGAIPQQIEPARFVFAYLMYMNVILATFNLLPALPLDGGRVLRSLLALRMPYLQATQVSARLSKFLAIMLGLGGFLSLNFFLMLTAFFIYVAVSGESNIATVAEMLRGIGVRDLMTRQIKTVPLGMPVSGLIQKMFDERHLGYPVLSQSGQMVGIVTLSDIKRMRESGKREADTTVEQIMSSQTSTIIENASALDAFHQMSQNNFGRLVVVDSQARMLGIISKTDLVRAIQIRMVGETRDNLPSPA